MMLSHLRGKLLIIWIPAFAGMTQFCANELSGFNGFLHNVFANLALIASYGGGTVLVTPSCAISRD